MTTETPTTEAQEPKKSASLLAHEMYGSDYFGEVEEPAEVEIIEEAAQEPSETEADEVEAQAESEVTEEEQEQPISSFSELVDHLEADPEWANSLEIDVKINGEPGKAKIADLIASYQTQEAATKRLEEAKAKAKEITTDLATKQEELQQQFAVAAELIHDQKTQLEQEESEVNWAQLKRVDPAEYSAKKLDFQERRAKLEAKISKAAQKYQETVRANSEKMQQEQQEYLLKEQEALYSKIPEWKDSEIAKAEKSELSEYLLTSGMTPEEIAGVSDHRLVLIARKAMLHDKAQKKSEPAKKRLRTIPKTLKPGASTPTDNSNKTEIARLKKQLAETGDISIAHQIKQLQKGGTRK